MDNKQPGEAALIAEYNQKQETFRKFISLFGQLVAIYLGITYFSVNYALQKDAKLWSVFLLGVFDILAGALGARVAFAAKRTVSQIDARLVEVSESLGIQHEGTRVFSHCVWAAFLLYLCVVFWWAAILLIMILRPTNPLTH